MTETNSKVHGPKTYNETIDNRIHRNRWHQAIDEELWNLDSHQAWCYKKLPFGRKAIACKWVFKVKYKLDRIIERYKTWLVALEFS